MKTLYKMIAAVLMALMVMATPVAVSAGGGDEHRNAHQNAYHNWNAGECEQSNGDGACGSETGGTQLRQQLRPYGP